MISQSLTLNKILHWGWSSLLQLLWLIWECQKNPKPMREFVNDAIQEDRSSYSVIDEERQSSNISPCGLGLVTWFHDKVLASFIIFASIVNSIIPERKLKTIRKKHHGNFHFERFYETSFFSMIDNLKNANTHCKCRGGEMHCIQNLVYK